MSNPSFVLRITRANQAPSETEYTQAKLTVGREVGDIALRDPGSSSKHAEILFADGIVKLRDVGSTNGTWVGPRKVADEAMAPGVVYTMGASTIELVAVKGVEPVRTMVMSGPKGASPAAQVGTAIQARPEAPKPVAPVAGGSGGFGAGMSAQQKKNLLIGAVAVVVGIGLVFAFRGGSEPGTGGGGGGKGTTITAKLTAQREAQVKAVWFKGPVGPQASGGTSPTSVRISPNDKGRASVGTTEQFAGGAGNQWKTATWLAAFSASQLTGRNLTDHEFLVGTGGHIDGPSAGMLMTATMVALLRGKTPRADTTMTGTINPDGSAGPVGGIVQKMDGASKDGIKRFGFPMGARNHQDLRTGRSVDLVEAGKEFGLEVREIHDVFEAYEFLTDDKLERPSALAESEMDIDSETSARLRSKSEKWRARLDSEIANIGVYSRDLGQLKERILPIAARADEMFKKAKALENSDYLAAAYESYVVAAVLAGITKDAARFLQAGAKQDFDALVAQVRAAASVKGQLSATISEAEVLARRKTGGGQINTLRAYQSAVIANAYTSMADAAVEIVDALLEKRNKGTLKAEENETLGNQMFQAIYYYSIAKTMLDVAEDQKDFGGEEGQAAPIAPATIGNFAAAYGSAAGAVLQYLESLTLEDAAREAGVDKATAQQRFAANDEDYLIAFRAVQLAEGISGTKNENNLLRLAAGSMAFLRGASLVNKYYSLGGVKDEQDKLTLTNRKALSAQLDLGRQLAREAAAKAKKGGGFVPVAARIAYQLGIAKREGDDEEKLAALEAFWESAFWSELAATATPAKK
jgi:predicted S18 family serine protease